MTILCPIIVELGDLRDRLGSRLRGMTVECAVRRLDEVLLTLRAARDGGYDEGLEYGRAEREAEKRETSREKRREYRERRKANPCRWCKGHGCLACGK